MNHRSILAILAAGTILMGCGAQGNGYVSDSPTTTFDNRGTSALTSTGSNLYVLNTDYPATVSVYAPGQIVPTRTISQGFARKAVTGMAFDQKGSLYLGIDEGSRVKVYPPGGSTPTRIISDGIKWPNALAIDSLGRTFVANELLENMTVYASGRNRLLRTIRDNGGGATQLLTDKKNHLYAAMYNGTLGSYVVVYSSGGKKQLYFAGSENSAAGPLTMALDANDNLYVGSPTNTITVYKAYTSTVLRTIQQGATSPTALAVDRSGNLYCACGEAIAVYAPSVSQPTYTITRGINEPVALVLDGSDNLYVANHGVRSITVYPRAKIRPSETITSGIVDPTIMAFGP